MPNYTWLAPGKLAWADSRSYLIKSVSTELPQPSESSSPSSKIESGWARGLVRRLPITVLWALVAQGLLSVTRLLTSMTVGGRFGSGSEEQLGYYSIAFSLLMTLIAVYEAFITTPLTVFNQRQVQQNRPVFSGHMLLISFLLLGIMSAILGAWTIFEWNAQVLNPQVTAALIAVAIVAPLQLLREFSRRWLLANLRAKPSAFLEILFATLFLLTLAWMVATDQVTAVTVFLAIGAVNAIGLVAWWWMYRHEFVFDQNTLTQQFKANFRYGRWVAGENVCSALTMYFCNWYLMIQIDEAAAGVFFACFTIVLLANPFLLGVCSILAPRAAAAYNEGGWDRLRQVLTKFGSIIMLVLFSFTLGLWFFGQPITSLVFGEKVADYFATHFDGQNQVTAVLSIAMPLMGLSYIAAFGLLAVNRPHDNFYAAVIALVVLVTVSMSYREPTLLNAASSFVISFGVAAASRWGFLILAYMRRASTTAGVS